MNQFTLKKVVLSAVTGVLALLTLIILAAPICDVSIGGVHLESDTGFSMLGFDSDIIGKDYDWAIPLIGVFCILQLLVAIAGMAVAVYTLLKCDENKNHKFNFIAMICLVVVNLFFMVSGIAHSATSKANYSDLYDITTLSWLGFMFAVLFLAGFIVANKKLPSDKPFGGAASGGAVNNGAANANNVNYANSAATAQPAISESEKVELLVKYKDLLDMGVITQEEYDEKKKDLL